MGNRVRIFVFFLIAFLLITAENLLAAEQDPESIKVRSAGERIVSDFINLDLSVEDSAIFNTVSKEDLLKYSLFQSFIYSKDYEYLLPIINDINDLRLSERLLYELLNIARKNGRLRQFKKVFNKLILERSEKLSLLINIIDNEFSASYEDSNLNTFVTAYRYFLNSDYKKSIDILKDISDIFPRTFYYYLINAGEFQTAIEFISNAKIEDKSLYIALSNYYLDRCDIAIEALNDNSYLFEKKLLLVECGSEIKFEDYFSSIKIDKLSTDPFLIYVNAKNGKFQNYLELQQPYKSLFYNYKLKSYIEGLSLYKDEIDRFVSKMIQINVDLKNILEQYDRVWKELEKTGEYKEIRKKIIDIQEKVKGLKNISFSSSFKANEYIALFDKEHQNLLDMLQLNLTELQVKFAEEQAKLKTESEIKNFLEKIRVKKKISDEEFNDLVLKIDDYYHISVSKKLPSEEELAFAKIYVLWQYSQQIPFEKKGHILDDLKKYSTFYLQKYTERKKDVLLVLAEVSEEQGKLDEAIVAYNNYLLLEDNPSGRILFKVAEILFDMGNYEACIKYFKDAAKKNENYRNAAQYKIGWAYYLMGKLLEVPDLFLGYKFNFEGEKNLILVDELMELLSRVFFKLGEDKIGEYLVKYPDFNKPDKLFKGVGDLHLFLADYDKALSVYEKGLTDYYLYKDSADLLMAKIELLNLLGKYELANHEKQRFVNLYGENSNYFRKFKSFPKQYKDNLFSVAVYFNVQYEKNNDDDSYKNAVMLYNRFLNAFREDEKSAEASFLLAQLEEAKKEYEKAAEHFSFAWQKMFREDESLYRALYCKYKLWQENKLVSAELINALKEYANIYPNNKRTVSIFMLLSDMLLKEKREAEMLNTLERTADLFGESGLIKVTDFCEANFKSVSDKKRLAAIFNRAFEVLKDRRFLELKHYSLFSMAKIEEENGRIAEAKMLYTQIIDDFNSTNFKEYALFNLAILLEKEGKLSDAVKTMELVKEKRELASKAKEFVYIFGKKTGFYIEAAEAALELSEFEPKKSNYYILEASWLFIKAGKFDRSEMVLKKLENNNITDDEKLSYTFLKAALAYNKEDFNVSFDLLLSLSKKDVNEEYEEDFIKFFHNTLKKTIFLKPEDDAREALEAFIDFLSRRFKNTAKPDYLFHIGEVLSDFSLFFVHKDEAISKAVEFYKRSLKLSVEQNNAKLVLKNLSKLKQLDTELYSKELLIPEIEVNLIEEIKHGEIFFE